MHAGSWHQISNHTPNDPDGYMMVVNASDDPSVFYEAPIVGLCANTTYQFSAWIINLLTYNGKKPNLTFTISTGQDIFTYDTGDIAEGAATDWIERGFLFTTPVNVNNITISIRNNGPGGQGNDIAVDDITFSPCGPTLVPTINNLPVSNVNLCIGESKTFNLATQISAGVYNNPHFLWQEMDANGVWQDLPMETTSQLTKTFVNAQIGSYRYRLLVAENGNINSPNCRAKSPEFELKVNALPVLPVSNPPVTVCVGDPLQLSVNTASSYNWTGPGGFTSTAQSPRIDNASLQMSGTYTVVVTNDAGCEAITQTEVIVVARPVAFIDPIAPICKGSSVMLNAGTGTSYRWVPETGLSAADIANPIASPNRTTDYTVYVSNGYCETQAQIRVEVIKELVATAGPDAKIIKGNAVSLKGRVSGENIAQIFWTPAGGLDDPTKLNPIASPVVSTTYTLNVLSSTGCLSSSDEVFIKVYDKLMVPNSFSPNGDGINDYWNVVALDTYAKPRVKIFNRYGQLMFESEGYERPWDGKRGNEDVPSGVYYYMIYLESGLKPLSGSLTLIR